MTKQDRQFNYIMFTNIADYSEIKSTDTKKTNNEIFKEEILKNNPLNKIVTTNSPINRGWYSGQFYSVYLAVLCT